MAKTGLEIIAEEQRRQRVVEGWTPEHDLTRTSGELAVAASLYALPSDLRVVEVVLVDQSRMRMVDFMWPFDSEWWKPTPEDRVRELAKAGALIASEIDRLLAAT